ncbi:MAG: hypothetical protein ACRC6V_14350 [Bacteroidales bacterium]
MALYGIPTGAMNPEAHMAPVAQGPTPEEVEKRKAALAEYELQHPTPLSAWANQRSDANAQDPRYAPIPEPEVPQGVLFESEGQPASKDEVPLPDMKEDPAGGLAATTFNRSVNGNGQGVRSMPQLPGTPESPKAAAFQAQNLEAKRISFDQNKIPKWYESKSFSMGLISFGLNMMSGRNAADSFNAAGKIFDEGFGREKRESWAEELRAQGYDDNEIMSWVQTGNNKELTDPNKKKMENMQYQMAQYNLENARYDVNEGRQAKAGQQKFENEMAVAKLEEDRAYRNEQLANDRQRLSLQLKEHQRKVADDSTPKMTARDYGQLASTVMPTVKVANQRIAFSDAAKRDLDDIKRYTKEGNTAGIQGSYKSFQYNMARAVKGGGATLTEKDVEGASALTSAFDETKNKASLKLTGAPSQFWIDSMEKSVTNDITNQTNGVRQIAEEVYNTYEPVFGAEEAQRIVGRIMAGGSLGKLDFKNNSLVSDDRADRVGPGTVKIQR